MLIKFNFPLKPDFAVQKVLEGLAPSGRVQIVALLQVETEDETVAALLRTLPEAKEVFPPGTVVGSSPPADHVVVTKPKREAEGKRKYRYNGGEKVDCPQCHNQVSTIYMLKDGSMCKMCSMKAKRLAKSQGAGLPETWTNQRPEFGREEVMANVQDKMKEKINLANLSGRRVG